MDAGTIIAIAVPNAVTALALWLTWKAGERRIAHGRELADLEAVRDLLDAAAVHLREFMIAIHPATDRVYNSRGHRHTDTAQSKEGKDKLTEHGEALDVLAERLRVRFGDHTLVNALNDTLGSAVEAVRAARELDDGEITDEEAQERVHDQVRTSQESRDVFMRSAQQVAGARLPDPAIPLA
jgi:hypothetical protein